jgi:2'-5' RNA ligase
VHRVFSNVGDTALVLLVPEAEPVVRSWRTGHDPSATEGMPAHVTVLYPFIAEGDLNDHTLNEIAGIASEWQPIEVGFAEFGRFPQVLWLKPHGTACLELLTQVRDRWPECLPYGQSNREVIPHLTITDGASEQIAAQAQADVAPHLPLKAMISAIALMAFDGRRWRCRQEFALGRERSAGDHAPRLT